MGRHMTKATFWKRNDEHLAGLQEQIAALRAKPYFVAGYLRLARLMCEYGSLVQTFLNGIPEAERGQAEDAVSPAIEAIATDTLALAIEANDRGIIGEVLTWQLAHLGTKLILSVMKTKMIF